VKVTPLRLDGLRLVEPDVFTDHRGAFFEAYHAKRYAEGGIADHFVQDNASVSGKGVLRGLHFQYPNGQAKLVSVLQGEVFDVAVDVRRGSPTFGQWIGVTLSSENRHQLYVPSGFAHGFLVLSPTAIFAYKCTHFYDPTCERTLRWDDPAVGIQWPSSDPIMTARDRSAPALADIPREQLPGGET
jgi:dTDP-4-dehydrorhamnose 3,5-epimerase